MNKYFIKKSDENLLHSLKIEIFNGGSVKNYNSEMEINVKKELIAEEFSRSSYGNLFSIGAFSYCVSGHSSIHNSSIGRFSSIASGVSISDGHHPIHTLSSSPYTYGPWFDKLDPNIKYSKERMKFQHSYGHTIIGNDVWIGANVTLKAGVTIGDGSVIASNSVVIKDVEPYSIMGGNPAKLIRFRFSENIRNKLLDVCFWNKNIKDLRLLNWENIEECIELLTTMPDSKSSYRKITLTTENKILEI